MLGIYETKRAWTMSQFVSAGEFAANEWTDQQMVIIITVEANFNNDIFIWTNNARAKELQVHSLVVWEQKIA